MEQVLEKASAYLSARHIMCLATVDKAGQPMAHSVDYCWDGKEIFFATSPNSIKASHFTQNANVAAAVNDLDRPFFEVQGVQLTGHVEKVESPDEIGRFMTEFFRHRPELAKLPPEKVMKMDVFKIVPEHLWFIDNATSAGVRGEYSF